MSEFSLKSANKFSIFDKTAPTAEHGTGATEISIENLHHYKDHKYGLYTGGRLAEMVDSIKAHGILTPLIVRPINDIDYEILAGHNRYEAAKSAGLLSVPCIIKEDLSDIDAKIIVHVTNANQRSLEAYSHSEHAAIIADYHNAIKQQGKRNDLLKGIDEALEQAQNGEQSEEKQSARDKFGLSKNTIARYVRIDKLIPEFKELLDEDSIKIRTGVEISYFNDSDQLLLYNYITEHSVKLDYSKAHELRMLYKPTTI